MNAPASIGLLLLRLALGAVFLAHGLQKFTQGLESTAQGFAGMGIPMAGVAAPLVASLEVVGGVLLIAGLATRVVAALLAIDMLVAMALVHLSSGFFAQDGGYEFVLLLAAASAALALTGPGLLAADAPIAAGIRSRRADSRTAHTRHPARA